MDSIQDRLRAHMGKAEIENILPDCREAAGKIDALMKALAKIVAMDPKGVRSDDLGRAARIARRALTIHSYGRTTRHE